jgi:hypothetical protein
VFQSSIFKMSAETTGSNLAAIMMVLKYRGDARSAVLAREKVGADWAGSGLSSRSNDNDARRGWPSPVTHSAESAGDHQESGRGNLSRIIVSPQPHLFR